MKTSHILLAAAVVAAMSILPITAGAQAVPSAELYGTGAWNADSLGNHRVVLSVDKPSDAVLADIQWRRRDLDPQDKDIIVIDAATGERISNVFRLEASREGGGLFSSPRLFRAGTMCIT